MRSKKLFLGLGILLGVAFLAVMYSPSAYAYLSDARGNRTYFQGKLYNTDWTMSGASGVDIIRNTGGGANYTSEPGFSDSSGYVMPNRQSTYANNSTVAGGAIGTTALGLTAAERDGTSDALNLAKKQKLFTFLKNKNQGSSAWERMGSALIVHQMSRRPVTSSGWGDGARTVVDPGEWNDLQARLVNDNNIRMTVNYSYPVYNSNPSSPINKNTAGYHWWSVPGGASTIDVIDTSITGLNGYSGYEPVWEFRHTDGTLLYVLEVNCANPLGGLPGFPPPATGYSITPSASITAPASGRATPGGTINGTGSVQNAAPPAVTSSDTEWRITRFVYTSEPSTSDKNNQDHTSSNPCAAFTSGNGRLSGTNGCDSIYSQTGQSIAPSGNRTYNFSYPVDASTAGGTVICFVTSVSRPTENTTSGWLWRHSAMTCRTVIDYNLTPTITLTTPTSAPATPGNPIAGVGTITNNGADNSPGKSWRITRFVYTTMPSSTGAQSSSSSEPCDAFTGGATRVSCDTNNSGTNSISTSTPFTRSYTFNAPSTTTDDRVVCFVASVQLPTEHPTTPAWRHSQMLCMRVLRYGLTPDISISGGTVVEPGYGGGVTMQVTSGGPDTSRDTYWRLTQYEYSPGTSPTTADRAAKSTNTASSSDAPCIDFTGTNRTSCDPVAGRSGTRTFASGVTDSSSFSSFAHNFTIPDSAAVGTKFCFVFSISPPTANPTPVWRHSAMRCVIVGKAPKMQVLGGDVRVGGSIETGVSSVGSPVNTYGSWGEYGVFSVGCNSGFASGSAFNNGAAGTYSATVLRSNWSKLTFANTGVTTCTDGLGAYNFSSSSAGLRGQFSGGSAPGTSDISGLGSGTYNVGNVTLTASSAIAPGRSIVIVSSGTVTIGSNITYNNDNNGSRYTSTKDIPQVVIRAARIHVAESVTRIDGWLLGGIIDTCYRAGYTAGVHSATSTQARLSSSICSNVLEVNGPVAADKIFLRRTRGADPTSRSEPAERFNLRADAYLWGSGYASDAARTVYSKELPPRL